jgi:hypothetical protein
MSSLNAVPAPSTSASFAGKGAPFWKGLLFILVVKVLLEIIFFVGVSNQYGEETQFVSLALPQTEEGRTYWTEISKFRDSVKSWDTWRGDPCDMYPFRVAALYPNIWFLKLFGNSEWAITYWCMLTGLGSVILVALIGRELGGWAMGLYAAAALALIPGHVLYTSRVDTDIPQLFFLALGIFPLVLALVTRSVKRQAGWALASGLAFGLLYLSKLVPAFLSVGWALMLPSLLALWKDDATLIAEPGKWRQTARVSGCVLAGFLCVFLIENVAYQQLSGHWLLHWHIMGGNAVNIESWRSHESVTLGFLKIWKPPGGYQELLLHSRMFINSLFPENHSSDVYQYPIHGWAIVLLIPSLLVLPFLRNGRYRLGLLIVAGFLLYFIYQEFLWVYPTRENGLLNITFVHKVHRFIFPCYLGIALATGAGLAALGRIGEGRRSKFARGTWMAAPLILTVGLGVANWPATSFFHKILRDSLEDTRVGVDMVRKHAAPGDQVFAAAGMDAFYRLFQYPETYQWNYLVDHTEKTVTGGFALVGGSNGIGLSLEVVGDRYPTWLRGYYDAQTPAPEGWTLLEQAKSNEAPYLKPIRLLRLPPTPSTGGAHE